MSRRQQLLLAVCVVGVLTYFFFWRILGAGLWAMSHVVPAQTMEVVGIVLSPLALVSISEDKRLVSEATKLPPTNAVERLRELIREYPPAATFSRSHWGITVRRRALDALADYPLELQATAVHEIAEAFSAGDGGTSYAAQRRLVELGEHAEPAIPILLNVIKSSEAHWHCGHAATILGAIAAELQDAFPHRSAVVWAIGQRLDEADSEPYSISSDFAASLAAIDPQGEHCVPYLIRGLGSRFRKLREVSFGALTSVAERNQDVRKWLASNGVIELSEPFKGSEYPPLEEP